MGWTMFPPRPISAHAVPLLPWLPCSVARLLAALAPLVLLAACGYHVPIGPNPPQQITRRITLHTRAMDVHFAMPHGPGPSRPLILYATGDGGWRGKDLDAFRALMQWGYPLAGFSAPEYLKDMTTVADTTTPQKLALDYARLIVFAKDVLGLPPRTPVILVGVSRGAGLAVVAAGQLDVREQLAGVLAVALTKEEEYVRHYRWLRGNLPKGTRRRELVTLETYEYLPRLQDLPLVVIQSTRDNYLPASEARQLFGPDTATRQFHAVDARNHSFGGAREELYRQMQSALAWIQAVSTERRAAP